MHPIWYSLSLAVIGILYLRKDLRREMLWAGLVALPVLLLHPLLSETNVVGSGQSAYLLLSRAVLSFSFGALAAALYKVLFRKHLSPEIHPDRRRLAFLVVGLLVCLAWVTIGQRPFIEGLLIGLAVDVVMVVALRKDLIWDQIVSGLGMGILYVGMFRFLDAAVPGDASKLWFSNNLSGLTLLSLPIEEVLVIVLFGALWGPLYLVVKDEREYSESIFTLQHLRPKQYVAVGVIVVILGGLGWFCQKLVFLPQISHVYPGEGNEPVALTDEITLTLNRPIDRNLIKPTIYPTVEGSWYFEDASLGKLLVKTLAFRPDRSFKPDQEYVVSYGNVSNIFGIGSANYSYKFKTRALPKLVKSEPSEGQKEVPICEPVKVEADQGVGDLVEFTFKSEPETELRVEHAKNEPHYLLRPTACFNQNTSYTITAARSLTIRDEAGEVLSQDEPEQNFKFSFTTKGAPGIAGFQPQGTALVPSLVKELKISFNQDMSQEDAQSLLRIEPVLAGDWKWVDTTTLGFTPAETPKFDTTYTVKLSKGLRDAKKGFLEEDATFSFGTLGPVRLVGQYPPSGGKGISAQAAIKATFDQVVDQAAAQQLFSLSPAATGSFTWEGNTLIFRPNLERDTKYTVSLASGIKSISGLNSDKGYSWSFETEESVTLLDIPLDYQDRPLSCEAASLKMALRYKGANVSEDDVMAVVGYDPTPRTANGWGDPDVAFVGNINGVQNTTGYGVHWAPIERAARKYRNAEAFSGWPLSKVAEQIAAGNPVVMWGLAGTTKYTPWVTPAGKTVHGWKGEHVRTIIGFTGKANNPSRFIINDPIFGRLRWSASQLQSNWSTFNNSGVVVY